VGIPLAIGQVQDVDASIAHFARQLGITRINITTARIPSAKGYWELADLVDLRKRCDSFGLRLEVLENLPQDFYSHILSGGPRREQQLDYYRRTLRNIANAGIPMHGFHFMATGVWRTDTAVPGRGGATVTAFNLEHARDGNRIASPGSDAAERYHADKFTQKARSLRLTSDEVWENYRIFLDAILPVADEVGLMLAHHPDDPPVAEIDGCARVFNSEDSFLKAMHLANGSQSWGINMCLGTVSEMTGGANTVHDMIARFGPLGKIRYVHLRDVQGTVPSFQECFLGEGNYRPTEVIRQLYAVGFGGWLQDDHVPFMTEDTIYGHRARAHAIGYMQGVLAAIETDAATSVDCG
jgi:mannonate dehydratase